jgi:hypothetical protein
MLARKAFFGVSLHNASFVCINQEEKRLIYLDHLKGDKRAIYLIVIETSTEPSSYIHRATTTI